MPTVTHPTTFSFDHDGINTAVFRVKVVDAVTLDQIVGVDIPINNFTLVGTTYTTTFDEWSIGGIQVGYDVPVKFTVQAFSGGGAFSNVVVSAGFTFHQSFTPNDASNLVVGN